jgi:hypothetical protein
MKFSSMLYIAIGGEDREIPVVVEGTYQPAEKAYTYPGEYAPTDPPEPEMFEVSSITIERDGRAPFDIGHLLSDAQIAGLAEEGIAEAAGQREEAEYSAAEARAEARQEWADMKDDYGSKW